MCVFTFPVSICGPLCSTLKPNDHLQNQKFGKILFFLNICPFKCTFSFCIKGGSEEFLCERVPAFFFFFNFYVVVFYLFVRNICDALDADWPSPTDWRRRRSDGPKMEATNFNLVKNKNGGVTYWRWRTRGPAAAEWRITHKNPNWSALNINKYIF